MNEDLCIDLGLAGSLKVDSAWHGDVDSDAESVDSEEEDALRHAGIWTLDEVSKMCCDKMTRLKTLYMAQYKRLFHVLKEKRRKYLQLIQAEQDGERYASEILQGITAHSKRHGVEAILHKQAKDKRHGVSRHQNLSHQRCTHVCDGLRCPNKILPLTKFCIHRKVNCLKNSKEMAKGLQKLSLMYQR
ncbi:hypothetical protein QZH41_010917 [Actinostola sp. cb2023]|nr:hypothetical protein QZH41_010917 [Actinostola sp. cb2023]